MRRPEVDGVKLTGASTPPEARGLARDEVRMLVAARAGVLHRRVLDLPSQLVPGDLLVVNTSATLPAAVTLLGDHGRPTVHVSTELDDGDWVVELRRADNSGPARPTVGEMLRLPGLALRVRGPHPAGQNRLWRVTPSRHVDRVAYLTEHGHPITYRHVDGEWPLETRQNVYAEVPGSAEMASAGRPLSRRVLDGLSARGVRVAPIVLHTGVSSQEAPEPPQAERYVVPAATAAMVRATQLARGRVVAVGTTVTRALETAADADGSVHAAEGWTDLVLGPTQPARVVDGLLTGLHEPGASHLDLLRAVAGEALVEQAYDAATGGPHLYLWHEFGDSMLFLP
jgi:S-adenosylmethionine:tRNA ribosyltransferase-isomerase